MSVASALAGDKPFKQIQDPGNSDAKLGHLMGMAVQLALIQLQSAVRPLNKGIDPALDSGDKFRLHDHMLFQFGKPLFGSHSPSNWIPTSILVEVNATLSVLIIRP